MIIKMIPHISNTTMLCALNINNIVNNILFNNILRNASKEINRNGG